MSPQGALLVNAATMTIRAFRPTPTAYCVPPLVVQGETMGLFFLDTPAGLNPDHASSWRQLVVTVGEGIKLSLPNLKLREIMREQAPHDPLTGLFNRRYLDDTLPRELIHARRQNAQFCIAMLDIDHFKHFNDTYGHEAGDLMLRELGHVLSGNIRKSDIACRCGGEEFVLVLLDSPLEASCQHLEKIRTQVNALQVRFREQLLGTKTLSVGIVEALRHNLTADELLGAVEEALYAAKRAGRDSIVAVRDLVNNQGEPELALLSEFAWLPLFFTAFNPQEGQQDFPPVFDATIDAIDLKTVFRIKDLQFFITTSALQQISRRSFPSAFSMIDSDLWLAETGGIARTVVPFEHAHIRTSLPHCHWHTACTRQVTYRRWPWKSRR